MKEIKSRINHRILLNYRINPEIAQSILPPEFKPKLIRGFAIAGICQVSLLSMRPNGLPRIMGTHSHNAAHRIAVESSKGQGVYVPRRDTNSTINSISGGRVFPGVYTKSNFTVITESDSYKVNIKDTYSKTIMNIECSVSYELNQTSIFKNPDEVSDFFKCGNVAWSQNSANDGYDTIELKTIGWTMEPLKVNNHFSSYFNDKSIFPKGSVSFDSDVIMRNLEHSWISRDDLRYLTCCNAPYF